MISSDKLLITGASSDIGITYLKNLQRKAERNLEMITVFAHTNTGIDKLKELQAQCNNLNIIIYQADLRMNEHTVQMIEDIILKMGVPTHILHLPAKPLEYHKIKDCLWDDITDDLELQVHSFHSIAKAFLPKMAKAKAGKIVVMLSECTIGPAPKYMSSYVTVKYALMGLVNALAAEYADKGIQINAVSPAMMETKFLNHIDERFIEMNAASSPLKRNVEPIEVARTIEFLLSDGSDYMTGVNLNVTGGNR